MLFPDRPAKTCILHRCASLNACEGVRSRTCDHLIAGSFFFFKSLSQRPVSVYLSPPAQSPGAVTATHLSRSSGEKLLSYS